VRVPANAKGPITFTAKLNYRKFAHYYTNYVYDGVKDPSGAVQGKPDVPIVTLAGSQTVLHVGEAKPFAPVLRKEDRIRWNDWGIGLLLQGDLKGAQYAFRKVTEVDPAYADGWLNVARALIQEGETDAAKPFLQRALGIDPSLARAHFFQAMIQKADGDYEGAVRSLHTVLAKYPRDRVALNQAGRLLFLQRKYKEAVEMFHRCLAVDAEDLQAHYNLMLAYRGLGDTASAEREERLFRRFKADESAQTITAKQRLTSPEDNNERQAIHEHESIPVLD
jgi:tetratricopeptide (TPR) repeat protein